MKDNLNKHTKSSLETENLGIEFSKKISQGDHNNFEWRFRVR